MQAVRRHASTARKLFSCALRTFAGGGLPGRSGTDECGWIANGEAGPGLPKRTFLQAVFDNE